MHVKQILAILILAIAFTAAAQLDIFDAGVTFQFDEFERTTTCEEVILLRVHPDLLVMVLSAMWEIDEHALKIARVELSPNQVVYTSPNPQEEDELFFRFPATDNVTRHRVTQLAKGFNDDQSVWEEVMINPEPDTIRQLVTTEEDVRFRFSPTHGIHYDDTLPADFLNEFSEFLEECL